VTPNQFHNQDSTGGMNPKEQYEKIMLLTWIVIQDIMFFLINKVFQCILYFREDLRLVFNYFPLKIVNIISPYTFEQLSSESYEYHFPIEEHRIVKTNHTIPIHIHVPYKIPNRYKPLILPPTLHAFPNNYYKYIHRFDGEDGKSLPKNIFKVLRIIWTYLRLMKMMLLSDFFLSLFAK